MIKITRFQIIKENGNPSQVVIGITLENNEKTVYYEWVAPYSDLPAETKTEVFKYIKKFLNSTMNQAAIDEALARKAELEKSLKDEQKTKEEKEEIRKQIDAIEIPKPKTYLQMLEEKLNEPKIEFETKNNLINQEII